MARFLHQFLLDEGVQAPEIQPRSIGDAYVRFTSPLERDHFLFGAPHQIGQYQVRFIKHDEGMNFRSVHLDREVWLMLMFYPTDARSMSLIDKAIYGFAHLLHVHPSVTVVRVIVKALINNDHDIPDDFVDIVGGGA
jgi:hypothetical protein